MLELLLNLVFNVIRAIQPFLVPICFVCAWAVLLLGAWNLGSATLAAVRRARYMHQIPCANCRFFTNDHRLKCPVHPTVALTEGAIGCQDYDSRYGAFSMPK